MPADQTPADRHGNPPAVGVLGPHVVGLRVVVRRLLVGERGPTGGPAMTDVLGICESWQDGAIRIRKKDGSVVDIATADIVSGKPVPPRASVHRRLSAPQADRLALSGWQPEERLSLGDWVLRASGGFSSRGNSVLAVGDPGLPLDEARTRVEQWYADRSLPPRAHVHPGGDAAATFAADGWSCYESTSFMLASVARVLRHLGSTSTALDRRAARHETRLDDGWLATDARAIRYGEHARAVLEAGEVTFVTIRDERGTVLARGRGAYHRDWVGISSLWTRENLRGTGLGSAVLESVLSWGAERGATTGYVQVVESNAVAHRFYESRGFEVHHHYDYLVAASQA